MHGVRISEYPRRRWPACTPQLKAKIKSIRLEVSGQSGGIGRKTRMPGNFEVGSRGRSSGDVSQRGIRLTDDGNGDGDEGIEWTWTVTLATRRWREQEGTPRTATNKAWDSPILWTFQIHARREDSRCRRGGLAAAGSYASYGSTNGSCAVKQRTGRG